MSRRRTRSRLNPSTAVLAVIVTLLGAGVVASAGWVPVFIALAVVLVLAAVAPRRRRRKSRH